MVAAVVALLLVVTKYWAAFCIVDYNSNDDDNDGGSDDIDDDDDDCGSVDIDDDDDDGGNDDIACGLEKDQNLFINFAECCNTDDFGHWVWWNVIKSSQLIHKSCVKHCLCCSPFLPILLKIIQNNGFQEGNDW